MRVYPVNLIEGTTMYSAQKESYSVMTDLYNRFMAYQVDFNSNEVLIEGSWIQFEEIDSMIIGNTNATSGKLSVFDGSELVEYKEFDIIDYVTIYNFDMKRTNKFILELIGTENVRLGYLFLGQKWELPRFVTLPVKGTLLRNEADRTFTGQVTGIPIEPLRTFQAEFIRIKNEDKELFDTYVQGVQMVIPHVIDPYYEAHKEFEPFFATVTAYGEATKRAENGFFWNFNCQWMEAR